MPLSEENSHFNSINFNTLFYESPQPMWILNSETLQFLEVNDSATSIYGYSRAEFLSMTLRDVLVEGDHKYLHTGHMTSNESITIESHHRIKNQQYRNVEVTLFPFNFKGQKARLIYIRDITAKKKREAWLEYLIRAGEELALEHNTETLLAKIADLIVPKFADWFTINIVRGEVVDLLMVKNQDPDYIKWAYDYRRRNPVTVDEGGITGHVIRTGESNLVPLVTPEMLELAIPDKEQLDVIKRLNLRSSIVTPMKVDGKVIGTINFISTIEGKQYDEIDLSFAKDFSTRIALALENARLHEEAKRAFEELKQADLRTQTINEELASTNEELAATNEELLASNDELDRANSEMAVVNEELSSTNEELNKARLMLEEFIGRLQESDNRFRSLIRVASVGIILLSGPEMKVEIVNNAYARLIGRTAEELEGRNLFDIIPEAEAAFRPIIDPVRETGEPLYLYDTPYQVNGSEGSINGYLDLVYQPFRETSGTITGVMVLCQDVTAQVIARQKLEKNERHFRQLTDLIPTKISNALPGGEATFFNKAWLDYSGFSFEDLRDFGYHSLMHPDEIETFKKGFAEAEAKAEAYESELRLKDLEGNYRWHLNTFSPVLDDTGNVTMWIGSTTEIQRIKEEELRKNAFIGMVSHELKTPLTSLNAYLQLLQAKKQNSTDSFEKDAIRQAVKQTRKMTAMVNGFLNLSRFDSSEILVRKQLFNINELLNETQEEMELLNPSYIFHFVSDEGLMVSADRDKIGHVLNNIISNACKYSSPGSSVFVKCLAVDDNVVVSVKDGGLGIKKEDLGRVFERYYRVQDNTSISGFGIGLYLCSEIIKGHEGKIWIESEPGVGSTFYFSLPINAS